MNSECRRFFVRQSFGAGGLAMLLLLASCAGSPRATEESWRRKLIEAGTPRKAEAKTLVKAQKKIQVATECRAYRAGHEPVSPRPDGHIICEAEEFRVDRPGWQPQRWGANYYAATFANTFLSRKAFLGAPAQCRRTVATVNVKISKPGKYLALVRYEAAYRFETQFTLKIQQAGKTVLNRLYGARDNLKIWAFRQKLKKEHAWYWGAVENVVWEGHNAYVQLEPGLAKLSLIAGKQKEPGAKRNVDVVMLTMDETQVKNRIEKENYLPLDGMLTQAGDVWMRVRNQADSPVTVSVGSGREHSPYWVHIRNWGARKTATAIAGQTSGWVEVGSLLDSLNDGQWGANAKGKDLDYVLQFGLKTAAGKIDQIAEFPSRADKLDLAYHGDTRYSRLVRDSSQVLYDLLDYLRKQPKRGRLPKRTLIYGYTFDVRGRNAKYQAAVKEFTDMFALSHGRSGATGPRGYIDVRSVGTDKLAEHCRKLGADAKNIASVSLGDEIGLARPGAQANPGFRNWLKTQKVKPNDLLPGIGNDWNKIAYNVKDKSKPGLYYWSKRYEYHYGIMAIKMRTDILRRHLPNAGIGANFSPHHGGAVHGYLGEVHKWVTLFRKQGMTMPWSEDYIWQLPMGTPQMNFINLDLSRAGLRHKPEAKIHYYVMPHWPGNTPRMWRRQFYGDVGHGMKIVNLFEFRPVQAAYTENHVSLPEMYLTVRTAFREMGLFEDIMQDGRVRPATTGLWFSETADIWGDNYGSFAAAKRALYIAIRHQQIPLDFVVEEDALDGTLKQYKTLYLTDKHVSRAASRAIAKWVKAGGILFATAGAGMWDELDQPNRIMRLLCGIDQIGLDVPKGKQVGFIKQDLPFVEPIARVTVQGGATWPIERAELLTCHAIGVRSRIILKGAEVLGTFQGRAPAITGKKSGKGTAYYCAFLPGLAYFAPAIPLRPVDRGSTDDAMAHFIPTAFDRTAAYLIAMPAGGSQLPVVCSEPLVEATVIESKHGTLIPLVNWSKGPVKDLTVTVNLKVPTRKAVLASGGKVKVEKRVFTLDLDVADALILR